MGENLSFSCGGRRLFSKDDRCFSLKRSSLSGIRAHHLQIDWDDEKEVVDESFEDKCYLSR